MIARSVVGSIVTVVVTMAGAKKQPKAGSGPPATPRIDVSLGIKKSGAQLPTADVTARFKKAIADGTLSVILEKAFTAVLRNVSTVSVGKACAIRDVADVKAVAGAAVPEQSVLFSGTLSQLDLQSAAASTIDCGRVSQLLACAYVSDLRSMLSPVIINLDTWTGDTAEGLMRCNCDAEVAALAVLRHWCGDAVVLLRSIPLRPT